MNSKPYIIITIICIASYIAMTIAFAVAQGRVKKTIAEEVYVPMHERDETSDVIVNIFYERAANSEIQKLLDNPDFETADDETRVEMATEVFEELLNKGYILEYSLDDGFYVTYTDILKHHKTIRIKEFSPEEREVGNTWLIQG